MLIRQIPIRNDLRNYMYLLACDQTLEAIAIDPLDHALCLETAKELGWSIKVVANTHHHYDHIDGNGPVIAATGAELVSHIDAMQAIPNVDRGLQAGDTLRCGELSLKVMDTPGHTMSHICLYFQGNEAEKPALFCGDTLFNAGVGRCDFGGAPGVLHQTFVDHIYPLADDVRIYPGHDYIENNLKFTLDREPDNARAKTLLDEIADQDPADALVTTLALEREVNTFFRLSSPTVIAELRKSFPDLPDEPDAKTVFLKLRELRNSW